MPLSMPFPAIPRASAWLTALVALLTAPVLAYGHSAPGVRAKDQSVANGIVSAEVIIAAETGWMAARLTAQPQSGARVMLIIPSEAAGDRPGVFEFTPGSDKDGPFLLDGAPVMATITVK